MTRSKIKNISISLIVTCLASVMTGWLSNDVNSDLIISLFCGKTDIEFSDFYNRVLHNSSSKEIVTMFAGENTKQPIGDSP